MSAVKPLFRVFPTLPGARRPWQVCGINLEGEPTVIEATYRSLKQAIAQAARANEPYAGITKGEKGSWNSDIQKRLAK